LNVDRDRWKAARVVSYQYSIRHSFGMNRPIAYRVIVNDGILESASLLCIYPLSEDDCRVWSSIWNEEIGLQGKVYRPMTIPQLFDYIDSYGQEPNTTIQVDIDPTFGYPAKFTFDIITAFDDEERFEIFDFKLIKADA
jgi:hypothetical protein